MKHLLILLIFLCCYTLIYSQVTIGAKAEPERASLLDLKTEDVTTPISTADQTNVTSMKGGLSLPRVHLSNRFTLEPFIAIDDIEWINATVSKIKEKHAGLTVYNIYESPEQETGKNKIFRQGTYTWDGSKWRETFLGRRFFACPPFNLPLPYITESSEEDLTFDVYAEYEKQFTKQQNGKFISSNNTIEMIIPKSLERLYKRSELDFVITYYDQSVLTINGIDANGVMRYRVLNHAPDSDAFINLFFVIKE
ncbi:hypothetical protein JGH11_11240 [Dysgonomonas sp. Marseille-P4677]|uniref:hypothetical protein n=1 Tax=Dysgonomonas sp. Marseille-P4677 TaxID=2364790 RepID=UPI001911483C|nr:hypothetical protein [Dysgonomonas sp. Marseille-P4677]MBK5721447.1 hypothetical protein [Dysgonomonas sp. Marseille-P4677]